MGHEGTQIVVGDRCWNEVDVVGHQAKRVH